MFDRLEGRVQFSASGSMPAGSFSTDDAVAFAQGYQVVLNPNGGGTLAQIRVDNPRPGVYKLPAVADDGSTRISGTSRDDVITAEATTGINEPYDGAQSADGEADFVIAIDPETGERFTIILNRYGFEGAVNDASMRLGVDQRELADLLASGGSADDIRQVEARIESGEAAYRQAKHLLDQSTSGRFVHYTYGGIYDCYVEIADDQSPSAKLSISGGAGDDTITVATNVPLKSNLSGGSGADVLTSGKKTTQLYGGGGKDRLINQSTRGGMLDGGQGGDRYYNRAAFGEVTIVGRDDGDQVVTASDAVRITTRGTLGVESNGTKKAKRLYLLVDADADGKEDGGQVDLLS